MSEQEHVLCQETKRLRAKLAALREKLQAAEQRVETYRELIERLLLDLGSPSRVYFGRAFDRYEAAYGAGSKNTVTIARETLENGEKG
ncbi:MAG: hypothetical protein GY719_23120 [bacterium]|nr:hypothetical protein [bacterium]